MRNLKKILALVLALVMSMSLVVTANAFEDTADVEFKEAIDVLSGLEVFQGRTETEFAPKASITRAEVAAIIYRIVTGDVENKQVGIYADYNKFDDVQSTNWFAGYVNYCANATYVGGYGNGKFGPNDPVTGYQALAMILRAVGYGKNGEFTGSGWEVRTASVAKSLGITNNILDGTLGTAATREMVAEILFRAILVPTVTWNMAFGYQETNTTLGYEAFKLECIEGVVVANEFANLNGATVLPAGKTTLETEDGNRSLAYGSALTDIGESRYAYVVGSKVLALGDTGLNTIYDNEGAEVAKLSKATTLSLTDAKHFENFSNTNATKCEYLLTYSKWNADKTATVEVDVLRDTDLTLHMENLEAVFNDKALSVYVGTKSTQQDREDKSDSMTWRAFKNEYLYNDVTTAITSANYGEWVKVVDNNGDGAAEYIFRTVSNLDEVVDIYTKKDTTYVEYKNLDIIGADAVTPYYMDGYEPAEGDIVLWAIIDGQALIEKANTADVAINKVDWRDDTVTTTDDETYNESTVGNYTGMDEEITDMDEETNYVLYLDHFGHIAAYKLADGTKYALVTEMYYNRYNNGQWVDNDELIAEVKIGSERIDEFDVLNARGNDLLLDGNDTWADLGNPYNAVPGSQYIVMQPATYNLAVGANEDMFNPAMTNIAKYTKTEDGVRLESAVMKDRNGNDVVNYVELDANQDLSAKDRLYKVAGDNDQVDAHHGTEYYLLTEGGIRYFTDYANLPAVDGDVIDAMYAVARNTNYDQDDDSYWVADVVVIEAANWTSAFDSISLAYYNRSQISGKVKNLDTMNSKAADGYQNVIPADQTWGNQWQGFGFYGLSDTEMDGDTLVADRLTRLTLGTYNKNKVFAGRIHEIRSIDNEGGYITADLSGRNPYARNDADEKIVPVDMTNNLFAIGSKNGAANGCDYVDLQLTYQRKDIDEGDRIIWVETTAGTSFIINVDYVDGTWMAPSWLKDIYNEIIAEQNPAASLANMTVKGKPVDFVGNVGTVEITTAQAAAADTPDWTVSVAEGYAKVNGNRNSGITIIHDGLTYTVTIYNDADELVDTCTVTVTVKKSPNTDVTVLVKGVTATVEEGSTGETVDDPIELWANLNYSDNMNDQKRVEITTADANATVNFTNTGNVTLTQADADWDGPFYATTHYPDKWFDFTVTAEDTTVTYYRVNLVVNDTANKVTLMAVDSTNGTHLTVTGITPNHVPTDKDITFTVTGTAQYEVKKVSYKIGSTTTELTAGADGKYTLTTEMLETAEADASKAIQVVVEEEALLWVTTATGSTVLAEDGTQISDSNMLYVRTNSQITVRVAHGAKLSVTGTCAEPRMTEGNAVTGYDTWVVSGIQSSLTLTVTP